MKNYLVPLIVTSVLTISVLIIRQKAQAQNASLPTIEKSSVMMAGNSEPKTNNQETYSIFVTNIPPRYRDWRLISVAHEQRKLNSHAAILGNDMAVPAYRHRLHP